MFENQHPELKKEEGYTSPASSLPLHELKMLQGYIHEQNLQNLGTLIPNYKKAFILIKFFKSKKNQLVEIYSRNHDEVIHTLGKVETVGRDFVMLKTLFTRIWIPYAAIHSATSPFGVPNIPSTHQHIVIDQELRRKLLTNFGETVSKKHQLRQQFYEELLETNLKAWKGTTFSIFSGKIYSGKVKDISTGKIHLKEKQEREILLPKVNYLKQARIVSFVQKMMNKLFK
ncbi:hypothetical protein QUF56_09625 [Ureibacillus composti]|nr:hypothetical protein [Ureibacillus composti]